MTIDMIRASNGDSIQALRPESLHEELEDGDTFLGSSAFGLDNMLRLYARSETIVAFQRLDGITWVTYGSLVMPTSGVEYFTFNPAHRIEITAVGTPVTPQLIASRMG
jgi:hypothetical protein